MYKFWVSQISIEFPNCKILLSAGSGAVSWLWSCQLALIRTGIVRTIPHFSFYGEFVKFSVKTKAWNSTHYSSAEQSQQAASEPVMTNAFCVSRVDIISSFGGDASKCLCEQNSAPSARCSTATARSSASVPSSWRSSGCTS